MDLESQNSKDARVEQLWRKLDTENKGELDLAGLKNGLKKINHPLKNADSILEDVLRALDKNGDGKIQYEEFRVFVEQAERRLLVLFKSLDRNQDGKLDKGELRAAVKTAGITIPQSELERFFRQVDVDNDGVISFQEWRNFLLFIPTDRPGLKAVLSYYSSAAVTINSEGDTLLSDDAVEGLGKKFLTFCFGSIINITTASRSPSSQLPPTNQGTTSPTSTQSNAQATTYEMDASARPDAPAGKPPTTVPESSPASASAPSSAIQTTATTVVQPPTLPEPNVVEPLHEQRTTSEPTGFGAVIPQKDNLLTQHPSLGFFIAGAVAGAVSRTATAPLDRLKTYLIANTSNSGQAMKAAAKGDVFAVISHLGRPLAATMQELWKSGGIRSLYSGNGLNVMKVMPESAIRFGCYETMKRAVANFEGHGDPKNINVFSKFLAGGVAGVAAQACVYPIDTLKFRMQCETVSHGLRGNALIVHTARSMIQTGGISTAYRGLTVGLLGMFPYAAIDFGVMEALKSYYISRQARKLNFPVPLSPENMDRASPGPMGNALIGACSGSTGATAVYPVNLLRTRLQAQGTVLHPQVYGGFMDVYRKTVEREGWRGLWKGITPNLLKVVPAVSISYASYEWTKKFIGL